MYQTRNGYILHTDNHNHNRNQNRDKNRDHDRKDDRNHIRNDIRNEKTSHPRSRSQKRNVHVPNDGDRATGRVNEKNEKIRQTDKSYLIMQLFICITRPERTILANYVQRSGPRCQAKHDGQRDQRSYDSTG